MDSNSNARRAPEPSRFHEAVFYNTATSPDDTLLVTIPDFSADLPFGDPDGVVWSPMGGALPQAGDRCLVAESSDGSWWVLQWWSDLQAAVEAEVKGQVIVTGTGISLAELAVTDNLGTTAKYATATQFLAGGTFTTDACLAQVVSVTANTTTFRALTRLGGNIPTGQTVAINYRIWRA